MTLTHFNMTDFWLFECLYYLNDTIKKKLKYIGIAHIVFYNFCSCCVYVFPTGTEVPHSIYGFE